MLTTLIKIPILHLLCNLNLKILNFFNFSYFSKPILTMLRAVFLYEKFLQFSLPHVEYYEKFLRRSDAFCSHSCQLKCHHHRLDDDDHQQQLWIWTKFDFNFNFYFFFKTKHWTLSSEKSWKNDFKFLRKMMRIFIFFQTSIPI